MQTFRLTIRQQGAAGNANTDEDDGSDLDEVMAGALLDDGGTNLDADMDDVAANDSPIKLNTRKQKRAPGRRHRILM